MSIVQPQPSPVAASVARDVKEFARALVAAVRVRQMYSPMHPNAAAAAERFRASIAPLADHEGLALGVTPDGLLVNGERLAPDVRIQETAALLNDHDILRLRIVAAPPLNEVIDFLLLLAIDGDEIRKRGGPARVWGDYGHHWLLIDQIDYDSLLASPGPSGSGAGGSSSSAAGTAPVVDRDRVWQSLVRSVSEGRGVVDAGAERRLRQITQSADAIHALAKDAVETQTASAGSRAALEAAQAATVLMTFQRLMSVAGQQAPAETDSVLRNLAAAASRLDPALLMRAAGEAAESGLAGDVVQAIGTRFDDDQIARLLAAALAAEGKASGRMAAALTTLTPDADRRGRILRMARDRAGELPLAPSSDLSSAWNTLEQFLAGPSDAAYVSQMYGDSIGQAETRAQQLRLDAPAKLDAWVHSVSAESIRTLSATLLLDLFSFEHHGSILMQTAQDLAVLAEDLFLAGDAAEAERVVEALYSAVEGDEAERCAAAKAALSEVLQSDALRETAGTAGDLDERQHESFRRICARFGPRVLDVLLPALVGLPVGITRTRLEDIVSTFEDAAVECLSAALPAADPASGLEFVHLLAVVRSQKAMAALHAVVKGDDAILARAAIQALAGLDDAGAWRVLAVLLRTGGPQLRDGVVDALAATHHAKAGGILAGALKETDPLGSDHEFCLRLLTALRLTGGRDAAAAVAGVMRTRSWWNRTKALRIRHLAVSVLGAMNTPDSRRALDEAASHGDFQLRRIVRAARRAGA